MDSGASSGENACFGVLGFAGGGLDVEGDGERGTGLAEVRLTGRGARRASCLPTGLAVEAGPELWPGARPGGSLRYRSDCSWRTGSPSSSSPTTFTTM